MSNNPLVTITNKIKLPDTPTIEKEIFQRIFFNEYNMFSYTSDGFNQVSEEKFIPQNDKELYFVSVGDVEKDITGSDTFNPPSFISVDSFVDNINDSSSGFLTFNESIAPRLFMTNDLLVDNGIRGFETGNKETPKDLSGLKAITNDSFKNQLFNWSFLFAFSGSSKDSSTSITDISQATKVMSLGGNQGNHYVSINQKDDKQAYNDISLLISQAEGDAEATIVKLALDDMPKGDDHDWNTPNDKLVIEGAFSLTLHILKIRTGNTDTLDASKKRWSAEILFGEVKIIVNESGPMIISIGKNKAEVELPISKTKEFSPQSEFLKSEGKEVIDLIIYPVWNGIVVSNGVQLNNKNGGVFIPKTRNISIYDKNFIKDNNPFFDPDNPTETVILSTEKTKVRFGNSMSVKFINCRAEISYLPLFFSHTAWFDTYFVGAKNSPGFTYDFTIYPIYTTNGLTVDLSNTDIVSYPKPAIDETAEFKKIRWKLATEPIKPIANRKYTRFAPELFGYHLRTLETRKFFVRNANGNFNLLWKGGSPGDPLAVLNNTISEFSTNESIFTNPSWWDYITNISISVGLDGLSGSISVDKYGLAGQDAVTVQNIGAIVIEITNAPTGTVLGTIFSGLVFGIADATSVGDASWTINLVGLDKKMEDIVLIDVPFFDGFTMEKATKFLSEWTGIERDITKAPNIETDKLPATDDINSPLLNYTAGTAVKDALADVMDKGHYWYYLDRLGKLKFYELDSTDFLPIESSLGPDREPSYPGTKLVGSDQTPDFEDLRNEIIVSGLTMGVDLHKAIKDKDKKGNKKVTDVPPTVPLFARDVNVTEPVIPWSKSALIGYKGFSDESKLLKHLDKVKANSKLYEIIGKVTIPGNAEVEPYDKWGDFIVTQVSHNLDFVSKSWTTDLELAQGRVS